MMFDNLCVSPVKSNSRSEVSEQLLELSSMPIQSNPFGPAIGKLKHVHSCVYESGNLHGSLHIATKAICFRCTTIFGWELSRIIIPLDAIIAIEQIDDCSISIKTKSSLNHTLEQFDDDVLAVKNALFFVWKEYEKTENMGGRKDKNAVSVLYNQVCLLSESLDSDEGDGFTHTTDSDEDYMNAGLADQDGVNLDLDFEQMWLKLYNSTDETFTNDVAVDIILDITLDDFFAQFLSEDATASLASHHQASGDLDVKTTKWQFEDSLTQKRCISYKHPIASQIAIAPLAGAATKTQIIRRYGDHGICVDTETWVNDVPLADCFYVVDRLLVSSTDEGAISLTVKFGVSFIKRTMFRGIITATAIKDVTAFHRGFIDLVQKTVGDSSCFTSNNSLPVSPNSPLIVAQSQSGNASLDKEVKSNWKVDLQFCMILAIIIFSCLDHIIIAGKLSQTTEKLAKIEELLAAQASG